MQSVFYFFLKKCLSRAHFGTQIVLGKVLSIVQFCFADGPGEFFEKVQFFGGQSWYFLSRAQFCSADGPGKMTFSRAQFYCADVPRKLF